MNPFHTSVDLFRDRADAGRRLAALVTDLRRADVVVLGLPRGGVPVALEVARTLGAPLDVVVAHKLGAPLQPELAMGAVGEGGVVVVDERTVRACRVTPDELAAAEAAEEQEVARRATRFRAGREPVPLAGRTAVVVDDGVATGATARAACLAARARGAGRVVLAVPVCAADSAAALRQVCDSVRCVLRPRHLRSVGEWYEQFPQVSDDEVLAVLRAARHGGRDVRAADEAPGGQEAGAQGASPGAGPHAEV
ncbi:phosphoribosyltransferase family protein [Phycicoccus sp. 3266]|uniref:phosphoribosyltransferase n=1 Tax=Phycicoccus sp. 3266 TaxID=2817751 RepID=UPI00285FB99F|nr:phosphoribosyltransferase family protein [Phycicoccus sp. 3266]MDR6865003.1 putative phosphoribosyltransferase [Phycicoccus sp. 3266]